MALGNIAPGEDVVKLNLPLCTGGAEGHTVPNINHNLLSMNILTAQNYITIFDKEKVCIFDSNDTKIIA